MKRNHRKPILLTTQTIRNLQPLALAQIVGGGESVGCSGSPKMSCTGGCANKNGGQE